MATVNQSTTRPASIPASDTAKARQRRTTFTAYGYLLPAMIVMGIITFYPLVYSVWMSFTDYGPQNLRLDAPSPNFVGFKNYLDIFAGRLTTQLGWDFNFWRMLAFNIWWTASNVIFHVSLGILIAVLLNVEGLWLKRFYRAVYVLPIIIPALVIATVWKNLFDAQSGSINQLLSSIAGIFGAGPVRVRWFEAVQYPIDGIPLSWSYFAMLITNIWLGWPFMTIVATGALQSVSKELYEAASIDGATGRQQFWRITLPLLRPAMVPAAMVGVVSTFNLFHISYFLSGGGPKHRTELLVTQAYRLVNEKKLYALAAAFGVVMFIVLGIITLITSRVSKATENYDA